VAGSFAFGGLIAGEGSFYASTTGERFRDGSPRRRFVFQLHMARRDRPLLLGLRAVLGFGSISDRPGKGRGQPTSLLTINSRRAHTTATIPFMETFLLPSAKRHQFEAWRDDLLTYEREHPRRMGRSICSEPGCVGLVRGRGLCRRHYYRATGW